VRKRDQSKCGTRQERRRQLCAEMGTCGDCQKDWGERKMNCKEKERKM
jgi:hypothetical protein